MKVRHLFIIPCCIVISTSNFAQKNPDNDSKPYIEVIGTAEKEVVPDLVFVNIVLQERYDRGDKITIEKQEENLKNALNDNGIDLSNLTISSTNSIYTKVKWSTKDGLTKKSYTLKISNIKAVNKVFQILDKLEINEANILKFSHSHIDSINQVVRTQAIREARNKAQYLLSAIGEQIDKPLVIKEAESPNSISNRSNYYIDGMRVIGSAETENEIQIKSINVQFSVYIKYSIKQ